MSQVSAVEMTVPKKDDEVFQALIEDMVWKLDALYPSFLLMDPLGPLDRDGVLIAIDGVCPHLKKKYATTKEPKSVEFYKTVKGLEGTLNQLLFMTTTVPGLGEAYKNSSKCFRYLLGTVHRILCRHD